MLVSRDWLYFLSEAGAGAGSTKISVKNERKKNLHERLLACRDQQYLTNFGWKNTRYLGLVLRFITHLKYAGSEAGVRARSRPKNGPTLQYCLNINNKYVLFSITSSIPESGRQQDRTAGSLKTIPLSKFTIFLL